MKLLSFDTWCELSDRKQYELYMLEYQRAEGLSIAIENITAELKEPVKEV